MKKIFTLSTIKSVLLMVAMCVSSQAFAFGDGAYALKGAAQPYPKAAGTVYCSFDKQNVKDIPADAWKDYVEATETGIMSTTTLYTYGKAAEGYQWTGVAYAVKNEAGELVPATNEDGAIEFVTPEYPYRDVTTHGEYYDTEADAIANMPEQPDTIVLALFGRVAAGLGRHMALLGRARLDNPCNEIGDEITLTAAGLDSTVTFAYWTKGDPENGEKITENPLKVKVTESTVYYAHFDSPNAVYFKGDEGTILWYSNDTYRMPGYDDDSDNSLVCERFMNSRFVDEKAPTDARATYYKAMDESNYSMYGHVPHFLTINGPAMMLNVGDVSTSTVTDSYNMVRWTGDEGLDTDFVECADGTENYFYYADIENKCFKLTKDFVLAPKSMVLVLNSSKCTMEGAPEIVYWSKAAAEAVGISKVELDKATDGKVYNLNGMQVNEVRKGIYVMDGKKFVK